jgi:EmrB/QacA subfamily drug resistance transporter
MRSSFAHPQRHRGLAFAAVLVASVMDLLDSTIAQVAAPTIRRDLGGSYSLIEWVTAAYALAAAVGLLVGGRLGDLFGRKRMLLIGMAGFIATSVACAAAATPAELILARAAQGATGAVMLPQVFGLIRDLFAPEEMGKAFGIFGPVMGMSAMLGPIVSGSLISADLFGSGWRMIFLVNVPIGIAALVVAARLLPARVTKPIEKVATRARLDVAGMLLAGLGMFLLVFPLAQGQQHGWPIWMLALLVAAVPTLAVFAWHQLRRTHNGRTPLVELSIFTRRAYTSGVLFSIAFVGAMGGVVLIFNVFLQAGLGFSAWHSAITTAPWAGGAFLGAAIGGITMAKLGRRVLHAGLVIEAAGLLAACAVLHGAASGVTSLDLLAPMLVGGMGMGMVFVPLFDIIMAGVEPHEIGSASGVLQSVNSLGMSLGVAGLGAVFFALLGPANGHPASFVGSAEWTILLTVALLAAAFAIAFWLPRRAREIVAPAGSVEVPVEHAPELSAA